MLNHFNANHEDLVMQPKQHPQLLGLLRRRQSGFSILEALIAAVIVSSGLLASAKFQAKLFQQGTLVKDRSLALQSANDKIEQIRVYPNNQTVSATGSEVINSANQTALNRSWTLYTGLVTGYNQMNVNVQWDDTRGATWLDLTSFISDSDPRIAGQNLYVMRTLPYRSVTTRYSATISGTIADYGNPWQVSVNLGTCSVTGNSYTCTVNNLPDGAQQNIDIVFSTDAPAVVCGAGGSSSSTVSVAIDSVTPNATQNFSVC